MPIHELGYRAWQGPLVPSALRFWTITASGVRLAWENRWLKRMLLGAWLPAIWMAVGFFVYEQWVTQPGNQHVVTNFFRGLPIHEGRHHVWSWLLWVFFRQPQLVLMVLVVGMVAPPLISQDVRTRAFLFYFSRPIDRLEYLLGKLLIVWGYLALITTVPAMFLYLVAVMISPDLSVVSSTWDLPLRILAASVVLAVPTTAIALAFSSMTSDTRFASFAWFAVWVIGWVTYSVIFTTLQGRASDYWTLASLFHTLNRVQGWVFGLEDRPFWQQVFPFALELGVLTVAALMALYRRISSPMRV